MDESVNIDDVPGDVLFLIFRMIGNYSIGQCHRVCKKWHDILSCPTITNREWTPMKEYAVTHNMSDVFLTSCKKGEVHAARYSASYLIRNVLIQPFDNKELWGQGLIEGVRGNHVNIVKLSRMFGVLDMHAAIAVKEAVKIKNYKMVRIMFEEFLFDNPTTKMIVNFLLEEDRDIS